MRGRPHRFRTTVICAVLCFAPACAAFGQSLPGWTVDAPPNSVQLVSAVPEPMFPGVLTFTFKNVSGKAIIQFRVDSVHGGGTGIDAFTGAMGPIAPEETISARFGEKELQGAKLLTVVVIVYADGSRAGSPKWVNQAQTTMLGTALETRRIANLLAAGPDGSFAGLDRVEAQINTPAPTCDSDAVDALRGIELPGVSRPDIDRQLTQFSDGLRAGLIRARQQVSSDIAEIRRADASEMAGTAAARRYALANRPHALADLAKKYTALSETQTRYIQAMLANAGRAENHPER